MMLARLLVRLLACARCTFSLDDYRRRRETKRRPSAPRTSAPKLDDDDELGDAEHPVVVVVFVVVASAAPGSVSLTDVHVSPSHESPVPSSAAGGGALSHCGAA